MPHEDYKGILWRSIGGNSTHQTSSALLKGHALSGVEDGPERTEAKGSRWGK